MKHIDYGIMRLGKFLRLDARCSQLIEERVNLMLRLSRYHTQ